jgi:uncharacterized membrane protein YsdA (DUF1294 family)
MVIYYVMLTPVILIMSAFLALVNLTAFTIMLLDKRRSKQAGDVERIPEGVLFFLATIGGGTGIYAGMFLLRHKTRKWYFALGIPLLIVQNLAVVYLLASRYMSSL